MMRNMDAVLRKCCDWQYQYVQYTNIYATSMRSEFHAVFGLLVQLPRSSPGCDLQ